MSAGIAEWSDRFQSEVAAAAPVKEPKPRGPKAPAAKIDPKYLSAARELRDLWLEHLNAGAGEMLLESVGKYDVSRALTAPPSKVLALAETAAA